VPRNTGVGVGRAGAGSAVFGVTQFHGRLRFVEHDFFQIRFLGGSRRHRFPMG